MGIPGVEDLLLRQYIECVRDGERIEERAEETLDLFCVVCRCKDDIIF